MSEERANVDSLDCVVRQGATFLGWPMTWFEECSILDSDGHLRDGTLFLGGGRGINFRMMDKHRRKAKWNMPNKVISTKTAGEAGKE